jgi:hypothetical protein
MLMFVIAALRAAAVWAAVSPCSKALAVQLQTFRLLAGASRWKFLLSLSL